jgi:hypothetical protein
LIEERFAMKDRKPVAVVAGAGAGNGAAERGVSKSRYVPSVRTGSSPATTLTTQAFPDENLLQTVAM